jgi:Ran GTPase-activating protein (RanGAP) involved in mRNA processing and transport
LLIGNRIENLNLEDNKLGDYAILKLLEGISRNKSLRILNLSKNYISDRVCGELKNILDSNEIYELYLHWNLIKAQGGKDIFEGLKSNESLKVLDLSYNSLGKGKGSQKLSCAP